MDESIATRFWSKVETGPGCWEWTGTKIKGHGRMSVPGITKDDLRPPCLL